LPGLPILVFAGGGEALQALLGDTVQLSVGALAPAHPHLKAGTIIALATTGASRWHDLPDVPTMGEAGFKDFVLDTYVALMAPARTPPEIVARLERETLAALARPELRDRLLQSGFAVEARTGKAHAGRIAREVPMFRELIERAGIKKL
jgi:tripartite-type tricarboxylate transporter receptor subunit TctC